MIYMEQFLGISMLIVPISMVAVPLVAWLFGGDKWGARSSMVMIIVALVWGLWIGFYHLVPLHEAYNNMCPPDEQTAGYCDTGTK